MDRGAWKAAVHGVAEGQTRLSDFTFAFHFHALEKEMATHASVLAWRNPGTGSLVGCRLWGRTASDTTEATQQQQRQKYSEWSSCLTGFLPANKSCSSQTPFQHREWQRAPPNQKGMNMPHPHPICKFTAPQLRTHFYGKVPQAKSSKDCWRYGG